MHDAGAAEGTRATQAACAQALDDGRTDDIVATFCPDGGCEIPGLGTHEGHADIRQAFATWVPTAPQRHVVVNTHVTDRSADEARASSDVSFLLRGNEGWSVQPVGWHHDDLCRSEGRWRIHRRKAEFLTRRAVLATTRLGRKWRSRLSRVSISHRCDTCRRKGITWL